MKILGKFFAVILSILYFAIAISFMTLSYTKNIVNGDFYADFLNSIDIDTLKVSDIAETFGGMEHYEDQTIKEVIVEGLVDSGVDEDVATKIIDNENIKTMLGNLIAEIIDYKISGGDIPTISKEDITNIVNDSTLNIEKKEFTDAEIDEIYLNLNNIIEQIIMNGGNEIDE